MIFAGGSTTSRVVRSALLMGCGALGYYFYKKITTPKKSAESNSEGLESESDNENRPSSNASEWSEILNLLEEFATSGRDDNHASSLVSPEMTMDAIIEGVASESNIGAEGSPTAFESSDTLPVQEEFLTPRIGRNGVLSFITPEITMDQVIGGLEPETALAQSIAAESSDVLPFQEEFGTPEIDYIGTNGDPSYLQSLLDTDGASSADIEYLIPPHFWDDIEECDESFGYGNRFYQSTPKTSRSPSEADTVVLNLLEDEII
ncbi:uncharacterized protein LOC103313004 isoform X2 [Tribolium castaneum]|uniref:Uncharacterized protein n=1 Tax=Tribolium castaneum TaxID=7070 RepID=D6WKK1_TRICA|nr:PREDICTED: uncharacterized protein LOC103313004 isoform X2 [Tribolium castaneum]EFA04012.2 hypothetical protein TcasGA2_TC014161 [Tribolium castaneum]|eukprot:XP_008193336.1 PREDICTED: uncharacterized protein LOC103313004 isoform X2 [Tribolium castaneum]